MGNMHALLQLIVNNALNVLGAVVILLIGLGFRPHFDAILKSFFGSLARYLVPDRHCARRTVAIRHLDDEPRRRARRRGTRGSVDC